MASDFNGFAAIPVDLLVPQVLLPGSGNDGLSEKGWGEWL